ASKLRPSSARGGVRLLGCACVLLIVPANAWAGESTQVQAPDAPPASAVYLPSPDAPAAAAPTGRTLGVHTVTKAKPTHRQQPSRSSASKAGPRPSVGERVPPVTTTAGASRTASAKQKPRTTSPTRAAGTYAARSAAPSPVKALKKPAKKLASAV